jgi:hypothetical protein
MNQITWKSQFTFGKYKPKPIEEMTEKEKAKPPVTLLSVLVTDKKWLAWCYKGNLDEKYPELAWIRDNVEAKEWDLILKAG